MKIIKVPFGGGGLGKTEGTAGSPNEILKELEEIYLSEKFENNPYETQEVDCPADNSGESHSNIYEHLSGINDRFILVGGDHSITYPGFSSFSSESKDNSMIIFDAHPDLMHDTGTASHEDFLRKLIEEDKLKPENLILVGLRNIHEIELNFLKEKGIKYFTSQQVYSYGIENVCDEAMSILRKANNFYVSIDIDVIDPGFAPATNHPEPGGITTRELIYFIQRLKYIKKPFCGDIVEVDSSKDFNNITSRTAAKIIKELI